MAVEHALESQPWWDALADGRLLAQRCSACGTLRLYPSPMCGACQSMDVDWHPLSGRGTVHSWTITHHTTLPGFRDQLPYALATVDMDAGVRLLAPLRDTPLDALRVGLPVVASFEQRDGGMGLAFIQYNDDTETP